MASRASIRANAEEILLSGIAPRRPAFSEEVAIGEPGKGRARFDRPVLLKEPAAHTSNVP